MKARSLRDETKPEQRSASAECGSRSRLGRALGFTFEASVTDRFEVTPNAATHFAWLRTRLSIERTFMAWVRTSMALIGFGFTIVQFFEHLKLLEDVKPAARPVAPRQLGLALIGAGIVALAMFSLQYRSLIRYMWSKEFAPIAGSRSIRPPRLRSQWRSPCF
jgi:putative membrane protein